MMSKSQNRTVDRHIIWSDMNLSTLMIGVTGIFEINEIDGN